MLSRLVITVLAVAPLLTAPAAFAQAAYPQRPITLVVQAAAGGGLDAVARKFAEQMQKVLGQPVVIDNRAGAGGAIGAESVTRAAPDGYTLLLMSAGETYYKVLNPSVKFDVETDFVPVSLVASAPLILAVNPKLPIKNLSELVAYAKAKPGELSYGTPGIGSPHHLAGEMLAKATGIQLLHVPYRGTSLAVNDVLANQLGMAWSSPVAIQGFVDSGRLIPIALADSKRIGTMPNVPTIAELGYPNVRFDNWFGIAAPKGTPAPVIAQLNGVLQQIGHDTAFLARITEMGFQPTIQGPKEFAALIKADKERYTKLAQGIAPKAN